MPEPTQPIRLLRADDHWIIPIQGWNVTRLLIDYAFSLDFRQSNEADVSFRIEGRFSFRNGQQTYELDAGEQPTTALAPALALFNKELASAVAYDSGTLELTFRDDMSVLVPADGPYEAWTAAGSDHWLLVCKPSGGLAVWLPA